MIQVLCPSLNMSHLSRVQESALKKVLLKIFEHIHTDKQMHLKYGLEFK